MKNSLYFLYGFLCTMIFSFPINAQESDLKSDELIFNETPHSPVNSKFGLSGVALNTHLAQSRLTSDSLQVGLVSQFSKLGTQGLSIHNVGAIPLRTTFLDLGYLQFYAIDSDDNIENWRIGRTNPGPQPATEFQIVREVGTDPFTIWNVALSIEPNLDVAIGDQTPTQKLDVDGNARFRNVGSGSFQSNLNITTDGTLTTTTSDLRLKENIRDLQDALPKILALRDVMYNWKDDVEKANRIGLIAQEVEDVVPELVFTNAVDGYKGIRYQELTALLIGAIQTQQQFIVEQQQKIEALENLEARLEKLEDLMKISPPLK